MFTFTGDWEFEITIDSFKGFLRCYWSGSPAESEGRVTIQIEEHGEEPLPEQVAAINYLLCNQEQIVAAIYGKIKEQYPVLKKAFGYSINDEDKYFPPLNNNADLQKAIGFEWLIVRSVYKDGMAYIGYIGECTWDDEHGIGIVMHKDRVVELGGAETTCDAWETFKELEME